MPSAAAGCANGDATPAVQREAEQQFKAASEAYTVLSDPAQRQQYDVQRQFGGGVGGNNPFGAGQQHPFCGNSFHFGGGRPGGFTNEEAERVFREAMGGRMGADLRDLEQQMRELERQMQMAHQQGQGQRQGQGPDM